MIVISDTNILSSMAAGGALSQLLVLFAQSDICIPPSVLEELKTGVKLSKSHLSTVIEAIESNAIQVMTLSEQEQALAQQYPSGLNLGEREAIALAQQHEALLLSNDRRAVRYCQQQSIRVIDLIEIVRLLWVRRVISTQEVDALISKMVTVENLSLSAAQRKKIFTSGR